MAPLQVLTLREENSKLREEANNQPLSSKEQNVVDTFQGLPKKSQSRVTGKLFGDGMDRVRNIDLVRECPAPPATGPFRRALGSRVLLRLTTRRPTSRLSRGTSRHSRPPRSLSLSRTNRG